MCINAEYEYCCLTWEPAAARQGADRWQQELLGAGKGEEGWGPGPERVMSKIA